MAKSKFSVTLASLQLGDEVVAIENATRYAVCHGLQGQFTPATRLLANIQEACARKFLGKAAVEMLTEALKDHAVVGHGRCVKRPGMKPLTKEAAESSAKLQIGLHPRIEVMQQQLARRRAGNLSSQGVGNA